MNDYDEMSDEEALENNFTVPGAYNRAYTLRRIEVVKEKLWLKKQLEDYDDWLTDPNEFNLGLEQ